ncbi:polyketide cyclase/dehydrase/lipid transport protein [Nocardioides sp. J9]|uniref:SRPBCC family protein n=1 Tax=Nocardioides sp. J9 TaxID=935844 RepID=UPI0011A33098|nr:SRPBCC family protein [Nocardioides sp. J9]TWH01334.1 polyketide cyclase/dehydrase/lipid transport protein [Nocardioides sp. J9]
MAGHVIHVHTTIPAPPERVWEVITDVGHADQVLRSVHDSEVLTDGGYDVGTTWRERRTLFGHRGPEELHVVEAQAPVRTVVEAEVGDDVIRTSYRLTPTPDHQRTRLAMTTTVEMSHRSPVSRAVWAMFGGFSYDRSRKVLEHDLEDIEAEACRRAAAAG